MKNIIFGAAAIPALLCGAVQTPDGAFLSVEQTCAYVDAQVGRLIGCDPETVRPMARLPVFFEMERNAQKFDGTAPLECDRSECTFNTGPLVITMDYSELRQ